MKKFVPVVVTREYGEYCAHMREANVLRPKDRAACPLLLDVSESIWYTDDQYNDEPCVIYERLFNGGENGDSETTTFCKHFEGVQNIMFGSKLHKICICSHPEEINKEPIDHDKEK